MAGDPFGLLLRQRIVFLGGEVNDFSADAVISQLLLLDSQAPTKVRRCMCWGSPTKYASLSRRFHAHKVSIREGYGTPV